MNYRLGLDLGTNSIGWAILELNANNLPFRVIRMGVRLFSDGRHPKTGESLASNRRIPKSSRRRRDRYLRRRHYLMQTLIEYDLMPADKKQARKLQDLNPYELRKKALYEQLPLHHIGRAIFHLNQRRGFKSNRKADKSNKEGGKIKSAIKKFQQEMNAKTVGEALYHRQKKKQGTRARLIGTGAKAEYPFYIDRSMIEDEFDAIWDKQQHYYPEQLSVDKKEKLRKIIFFQRPLKPQEIGKCFFHPDTEKRAAIALPSSQLFRLYQDVNHLRLIEKSSGLELPLTRFQRDEVIKFLRKKQSVKFPQIRRLLFKEFPDAYEFTIEQSGIRKMLYGDTTANKLQNKKGFGQAWHKFSLEEQEAIVSKLLDTENEQELLQWLQSEYHLTEEQADYISNVPLEEGYLRIGKTAVSRILPPLMEAWDDENNKAITYDKAVKLAGYDDHRVVAPDTLLEQLPYYGEVLSRYTQAAPQAQNSDEKEYGKIANPTVHIGLNQVRKLINEMIKKYGVPNEIIVELARELKLNKQQKDQIKKQQKENLENNEKLNQRLKNDFKVTPNAANRTRLKLYDELGVLNHRCILSGEVIKASRLFTRDYEIDHILPFSRTLDDSFSNKILVTHRANADKANKTPYEAFGNSPKHYNWDDIETRASNLPYNKRKRFKPEAYSEWFGKKGDFAEDGRDFIARQLTDTAYLSRVTREYLQTICSNVSITPGRLTGMLRGKWGFNKILSDANTKNRTDHRHHAIDAAIIAMTDRKLLQEISRRAGQAEETAKHRLLEGFDKPEHWQSFYQDIRNAAEKIVISYKPDHNPQAALHNETAYGMIDYDQKKNIYTARVRIPLSSISTEKQLDNLLCENTKNKIKQAIAQSKASNFKEAIKVISQLPTMPKRVRKKERISGITVALRGTAISTKPEKQGEQPVKLYKGDSNYCYEIYNNERGKWTGSIITTFTANQKPYQAFMEDKSRFYKQSFDGKPLIMRLVRDDLIAIEENNQRRIMRVQKMTKGAITLAEHYEGNADARSRDKNDPFKLISKSPSSLQKLNARKVFVNILGYVFDPQPKE